MGDSQAPVDPIGEESFGSWLNQVTSGELLAHTPALFAFFREPGHVPAFANQAFVEVAGGDAFLQAIGRPLRELPINPQARHFVDKMDEVYESGKYYVESGARLVLPSEDGGPPQERFFDFSYEPTRGKRGEVDGIIVVAVEVTRLLQTERLARGQRRLLEQIALDAPLGQVLDGMLRLMEDLLPGSLASALLVDADGTHLRFAAAPSLPVPLLRATVRIPITPDGGTSGRAAYTRAPVTTPDVRTDPSWKNFRDQAAAVAIRSAWSVPIMSGQELLGVFTLYHRHPYQPNGDALALGSIVARTAALAIERDRVLSARRTATERLALLAEITTVLISTLDAEEALRRLTRLLVPRLADWAVTYLRVGEDEVTHVAVMHHEGLDRVPADWAGPLPPIPERSPDPLPRALREGLPTLLGPAELAAAPHSALQARQQDLFDALGATTAIVVPLQVVGALTVVRTDPDRRYDQGDLRLLEDIGRRAGLAVDNARLFAEQRSIAETMQHHLLTAPPRLEGLELAARYLPAPEGSQVGGDWYDAFVLSDGALVVVIGDVAGHDLKAAAQMAQLRSGLRAIAWDRLEPPSFIVSRLDSAMTATLDTSMATLILGRVERGDGEPFTLRWTNAGHPPPLLIGRDGDTRYLEEAQGILLGLDHCAEPRPDAAVRLPAGSTLLLYTDGLVESARIPLEQGMARLRRNAASLAHRPPEELCAELLTRLPEAHTDDIALLALRVLA